MKNGIKKLVSLILVLVFSCTMLFGMTACELFNGDTTELNDQIGTLTKQLDDVNAKLLALEAEKALLDSELSDLEAEKESLESELSDLEAEKESLESELSDLEAETNEQISNLNKEKEELEASEEALRNCLAGIHTFSGATCTTCGFNRGYTRDGDYIYLGEFPQTLKADDVTITSETDSRGYYLGSDGNYYAAVTADPYVDGMAADPISKSTFTTGASVVDGEVYYFKVEPIRWRIITEENGEALLLCDSIIASLQYQTDYQFESSAGGYCTTSNGAPSGTYANNYMYSNVRIWLNETFYETAFNKIQQGIVLTTDLDNSAESASPHGIPGNNKCVCENTSDKVFLISMCEATNEAYGFASYTTNDTERRLMTSDYSRAIGAYMDTSADYNGNGWWWTRSPYDTNDRFTTNAYLITEAGRAFFPYDVGSNAGGVVPALIIKLNP